MSVWLANCAAAMAMLLLAACQASSTGRLQRVSPKPLASSPSPESISTLPPRVGGVGPTPDAPPSSVASPVLSPSASLSPSPNPSPSASGQAQASPSPGASPTASTVNLAAWSVAILAGAEAGFANGSFEQTRFNNPNGLAARGSRLWVTDTNNHRIRRLDFTESSSITVAGSGGDGAVNGGAEQSQWSGPLGLDVAPDGSIFVADTGNHQIRQVPAQGDVTLLAGAGEGFLDGQGSMARLARPFALCLMSLDALLVADAGNNRLRQVRLDGSVITLPGLGTRGYVDGPLSQSQFSVPSDVVALGNERFAVADYGNRALRVVDLVAQRVETWLGPSRLMGPTGVCVDAQGLLWVADSDGHRLLRVRAKDQVDLVLGTGTAGEANGNGLNASFNGPSDLVVLDDGRIVVADAGNHRLRIVTPAP